MTSRVVINGRFLTRKPSGVDRFAIELLRAWLPQQRRPIRAVMPDRARAVDTEAFNLPVQTVGALNGHAWEQFDLPRFCRDEMMLNLCSSGPILHRRQLVVLHDANTVANPWIFSFAYRNWYRWLFAGLMRRAHIVATVSKFSASELMRHIGGRAAARIEIIYEGGEHILRAASDRRVLERLALVDQPYVLAVGNRSPNKNFSGIVKAAAMLAEQNVKVVAAGGGNSRVFAGAPLSGRNLVLAGYVTDAELRALYEHALCFVYPSFYEGFGIPPLEAMHCGCPVVASNSSSIPEVCGDAALYCNPADPKDIAQQVQRVLMSRQLRGELREAGYARTGKFSWPTAAIQLEDILSRGAAGSLYA
jgi:glycosyltransferase involved in cell wall biosynthesis